MRSSAPSLSIYLYVLGSQLVGLVLTFWDLSSTQSIYFYCSPVIPKLEKERELIKSGRITNARFTNLICAIIWQHLCFQEYTKVQRHLLRTLWEDHPKQNNCFSCGAPTPRNTVWWLEKRVFSGDSRMDMLEVCILETLAQTSYRKHWKWSHALRKTMWWPLAISNMGLHIKKSMGKGKQERVNSYRKNYEIKMHCSQVKWVIFEARFGETKRNKW